MKHIFFRRFFALSAAHCLPDRISPSNLRLRGGSTFWRHGGFLFNVQSYINHPMYDAWSLDCDIALIRVADSTPLQGPNVQHLPLPPICNSPCCSVCVPGNDVIVAGWGAYDDRQGIQSLIFSFLFI